MMIAMLLPLLLLSTNAVTGFTTLTMSSNEIPRRDVIQSTFVAAATGFLHGANVGVRPAGAAYIDPTTDAQAVTKRVYLDIQIGAASSENEQGRIVIGLFGDLMPRTSENFVNLCEGRGDGSASYAGTTFYRVLSDLTIQGGSIGDETGRMGRSSFPDGASFEPDNYNLKHTREGLVSMVRSSLNGGADSRFFINTNANAGWADDKFAAFGVVEDGMDFIHRIEKVDVKPKSNSPREPVMIVGSGILLG